jgi:hypothetical protein
MEERNGKPMVAEESVPGVSVLFSRSPMTAFARLVAADAGHGDHVGAVATGMVVAAMLARSEPQQIQALLTAHVAAIGDDLDRSGNQQAVARLLAELARILGEQG